MNPFEMVVLIVAIVAVARVLSAKYAARTRNGEEDGPVSATDQAETHRLREDIRGLKDRIAVLERIVTDGDRNRSIALEREIEALRTDREKEVRP
jgi:hypothetical protein